jgi:Ni,Fe-hydrogenase III small subunit
MFANSLRRRALSVYLLHMGGPNGDALEWEALFSTRFLSRLNKMGVTRAASTGEADVVLVTGLLTERNLDKVLTELANMHVSSTLVVAGDAAIDGGEWAEADLPGLSEYPLSHYVDVQITVPGNPPTPQALLVALGAAVSAE